MINVNQYLYAELLFYLTDMALRGDDVAKQLLDSLPEYPQE